MHRPFVLLALLISVPASAGTLTPEQRAELLSRAAVWQETNVATKDLRVGPRGPGSFAPGELVTCDYDGQDLEGNSPKFKCRLAGGDSVKVKFGARNGEVQGEVAASRLLWALGFGADRMYSVRVVCRGCPATIGVPTRRPGEQLVDPAAIERPVSAGDVPAELKAWSWTELDAVDDRRGAPRAHRDALKLLAVLLQHTDSKPQQQRLVCRNGAALDATSCREPFLMINDLGLTFGRAHFSNSNEIGSVNLREWIAAPVWKNPAGCVGNLPKSFTGTLRDPVISEDGRAFLARLLVQLSDAQLRDLFAGARMDRRDPKGTGTNAVTVGDWVDAFKRKRDEIVNRRCLPSWSSEAPLAFDTTAIRWLQSWATPPLTGAMNAISLLGYTRVFIALAVVVAFVHRLRVGASLLLLVALTGVLTDAAKATAGLPRPTAVDSRVQALTELPFARNDETATSTTPSVDDDDVYGFPSGHIATTTAFLLGLALLAGWRGAGVAALLIVPLMALSRLYLGRHFPADLIAGVAIAAVATPGVVRLRPWRMDDPRAGRRTALRIAALGVLVMIACAVFGIPPAYEAGRLAGCAAAVALLGITGAYARRQADTIAGVRRIAIAAALFGLVWWATDAALIAWGVSQSIAGQFAAGGLPAFVLLPGPIWLERLLHAHFLDHRRSNRATTTA